MKKTIFLGIAVLMALAIMSCDFGSPGDVVRDRSRISYDDEGRMLVELDLNVEGGGRAMTSSLAKLGINFFEASFTQPSGAIARTTWNYAQQKGKIRLEAGATNAYTGPDKATLLAGNQDDKTLLAIGLITQINGGASIIAGTGNVTIDADTTSITFTLLPLTANVHGGIQGAAGNSTNSSFLITAPTSSPEYATTVNYATKELPRVKVSGQTVPVFEVPATSTAIKATYTVLINGSAIPANNVYFNALVKSGTPTYGYKSIYGDLLTDTETLRVPMYDGTFTIDFTTSNGSDGTTFTTLNRLITFDITTAAAKAGLVQVAFEYPVMAINHQQAAPISWFIRGGLMNSDLDEGGALNSYGGAIVFGIGDIIKGGSIEIGTTGP